MDVPLVVSNAFVAALVVEPVHEVAPDLGKTGGGDDVGLPIVLVACVGKNSAIDVSWKIIIDFEYYFPEIIRFSPQGETMTMVNK